MILDLAAVLNPRLEQLMRHAHGERDIYLGFRLDQLHPVIEGKWQFGAVDLSAPVFLPLHRESYSNPSSEDQIHTFQVNITTSLEENWRVDDGYNGNINAIFNVSPIVVDTLAYGRTSPTLPFNFQSHFPRRAEFTKVQDVSIVVDANTEVNIDYGQLVVPIDVSFSTDVTFRGFIVYNRIVIGEPGGPIDTPDTEEKWPGVGWVFNFAPQAGITVLDDTAVKVQIGGRLSGRLHLGWATRVIPVSGSRALREYVDRSGERVLPSTAEISSVSKGKGK